MNKYILIVIVLLISAVGIVIIGNQKNWFNKEDKTTTTPQPFLIGPIFNERDVQGPQLEGAQPPPLCEHKLAIGTCAFCDETLIESLGFCHGHDVPEAFCTRCNSSLIIAFKTLNDWCEAHALPESQCYICDPDWNKKKEDKTIATPQSSLQKQISNKNILRIQQNPSVACSTESLQIQFLSSQTAVKAGFEYASIIEKEMSQTITCYTQITYNEHRFARLSPRASGVIAQVYNVLGDSVKVGATLALIDSSHLGTAKSQYLQSNALVKLWQQNFIQEKSLLEKHAATTRDVLEAQTKLTESKITLTRNTQRLKNLGLTDLQIEDIINKNDTSSLLPLTAPFGGVIVNRDSVIGEVVDTAKPIFAIADTSKMWAILEINETETQNIQVGQRVIIAIESISGIQYSGDIHWVSTHIDPKTRMLKARVELANDNKLLKAGMFGKAIISIKDKAASLVVPKSAVQWEGCCNVVFVKLNDYMFEPRKISIDFETDHHYVVSGNVNKNETVVTTGSFLLKTEILKGSIGAGCCEVSPGK